MKMDIIAAVMNVGQGNFSAAAQSAEAGPHSFEDVLQAVGALQFQGKNQQGLGTPSGNLPKGNGQLPGSQDDPLEALEQLGRLLAQGEGEGILESLLKQLDLESLLDQIFQDDALEQAPWLVYFLQFDVPEEGLSGLDEQLKGLEGLQGLPNELSFKELLAQGVPEELLQQWDEMGAAERKLTQAILAGLLGQDAEKAQGQLSRQELEALVSALQAEGQEGKLAELEALQGKVFELLGQGAERPVVVQLTQQELASIVQALQLSGLGDELAELEALQDKLSGKVSQDAGRPADVQLTPRELEAVVQALQAAGQEGNQVELEALKEKLSQVMETKAAQAEQAAAPADKQDKKTARMLLLNYLEGMVSRETAGTEDGKQDQTSIKALEDALLSGKVPLTDHKGNLTPQAAALLASYVQQERPLDELPRNLFQQIQAFFADNPVAAGEENAEKSTSSLFSRVEQFFRTLLLGDQETSGQQGNFQGMLAEQLEEKSQDSGRQNPSNLFRGADSMLSALSNRSEAASSRGFAASLPPNVQPQEVLGQIVERMNLLNRPGGQEIRIRLQPEILGEVMIRMRRIQGVLSAEIMTQNTAVKEMIESQMDSLRQRFQEMDLNVEEFHVSVGEEGQDDSELDRKPKENMTGPYINNPQAAESQEMVTGEEGPGGYKRVNYLV